MCVLNAQSVGSREKHTETVELIGNECTDIMFLMEMWMRSYDDEAKRADLTPPGYSFRPFPRAMHGSGLAVILRESFHVTITTSFPFTHTSLRH